MKNQGKCTCPRPDIHVELARLSGADELDLTKCSTTQPRYIHLVTYDAAYEGFGFPEAAFWNERSADLMAARLNRGSKSASSRYEVLSVPIFDDETP